MFLLADENFPRPTVEALRRDGHDVVWVRTSASGENYSTLLEKAEAEGRLFLTLDKDFWQLVKQRPKPISRSGIVLFRIQSRYTGEIDSFGAPRPVGHRKRMAWVHQPSNHGQNSDDSCQACLEAAGRG